MQIRLVAVEFHPLALVLILPRLEDRSIIARVAHCVYRLSQTIFPGCDAHKPAHSCYLVENDASKLTDPKCDSQMVFAGVSLC